MKKAAVILTVCLLLALCACEELPATVLPAASASPTQPVSETPVALPTPAPSPTPIPSRTPAPTAAPAADIPDVVLIESEPVIHSSRGLCEDSGSVYFSSWYYDEADIVHSDLYRIRKPDGSAARIAQEAFDFALSDGSIYYTTGEPGEYETICDTMNRYDIATGETSQVFQDGEDIYHIAVYDGRIYYSADPHPEQEYEFYSDLFSRNMDGSDRRLVVEYPISFCFCRNSLYFMSGGCGDGTPISQCDIDGGHVREIVEWASGAWHFEISGNYLVYCCFPDDSEFFSLIVQDLETGEQQIYAEYSDFAMMGQYAVVEGNTTLDAIDIRTGETYNLMELTDDPRSLYSGDGCIYISEESDSGAFTLYRLTIENGSAALKLFAQLEG